MGSNAKGSAFERQICKALSGWVTKQTRSDVLWRSATSGGRARVGLAKGDVFKAQAGDISSIALEGHPLVDNFMIECKHYKDLNLVQLITKNKGNLAGFWLQLWDDAREFDKLPMLIAKQNQYPILLGLFGPVYNAQYENLALGIFPCLDLILLPFERFIAEVPFADFIEPDGF